MIAALAGLTAGALHVLSGPDHLAALVPLALQDQRAATRTGLFWGVGHGLGVLLLGGLGLLARALVDVSALSGWSERLVGLLLIGVGLWTLRRAAGLVVHAHPHGRDAHAHLHVHLGAGTGHRAGLGHPHGALGVGLLHGAAGTGHLFGVIPSLALPPAQAAAFLLAYLVAAVLSMGAVGAAVGRLSRAAGPRALRGLMAGAGLMAVAVGGLWISETWI